MPKGEFKESEFVPAHPTNYREGRTRAIDTIVIHVTQSDRARSAANWFAMRHAGPSSTHYIVDTDGTLFQCVREDDTAYGAPGFNANGLHIEHAGWVNATDFAKRTKQLEASAELVRHLAAKYGIPVDRTSVRGHSELPGSSHSDPGRLWPWKRYMAALAGEEAPKPNVVWNHPDGIRVKALATYSLKWPPNAHHTKIDADERWNVWDGGPEPRIKLLFNTKGKRRLTAVAYDKNNHELVRETLDVRVV